jgi:hypothetical protein
MGMRCLNALITMMMGMGRCNIGKRMFFHPSCHIFCLVTGIWGQNQNNERNTSQRVIPLQV